jgi:hypothetical protein
MFQHLSSKFIHSEIKYLRAHRFIIDARFILAKMIF